LARHLSILAISEGSAENMNRLDLSSGMGRTYPGDSLSSTSSSAISYSMKALAKRLGASYVWGLINFTVGVAAGAFWTGLILGLYGFKP
jgi:hypothetical protein